MSGSDFTGDLDEPEPQVLPGPLPPEVLARIDAALDAVDKDWQEVDCFQLDGMIISAKAMHIAVTALRNHLHDPACWAGAQEDTSGSPAPVPAEG